MAAEGVIFPSQPLLIISKHWNVPGRTNKTRRSNFELGSQFRVHLLGRPARPGLTASLERSTTTSRRNERQVGLPTHFQFLQSRHSLQSSGKEATDDTDSEQTFRKAQKSKSTKPPSRSKRAIDYLLAVPTNASTPFYGYGVSKLITRYAELVKHCKSRHMIFASLFTKEDRQRCRRAMLPTTRH